MSGPSTYQPQNPFLKWLERRLPIVGLVYSSFVVYPTPRNLNYWWTFGGILTFMLAVQIVTRCTTPRTSISRSIPSNTSCAT
jgi:ubiquinol-cytochrome c reductase cytochrome b/c1 subunit